MRRNVSVVTDPVPRAGTSTRAAATASWIARLIPTPPTVDIPASESAEYYVQETNVVKGRDQLATAFEPRQGIHQTSAKALDAGTPQGFVRALPDDHAHLEVFTAIDQDHQEIRG